MGSRCAAGSNPNSQSTPRKVTKAGSRAPAAEQPRRERVHHGESRKDGGDHDGEVAERVVARIPVRLVEHSGRRQQERIERRHRSDSYGLRNHQVQQPLRPADGLHRLDPEAGPERRLEALAGVGREDVGPRAQHPLHLRVALGHELDDQRPAEPREEGGDPLERQVVADGEVVHERQRQQRVGRARAARATGARGGPSRAPGEGLVRSITERQDPGLPVGPHAAVVALDRGRIDVERDDPRPRRSRAAGCTRPCWRRGPTPSSGAAPEHARDQRLLGRRGLGACSCCRSCSRPTRCPPGFQDRRSTGAAEAPDQAAATVCADHRSLDRRCRAPGRA